MVLLKVAKRNVMDSKKINKKSKKAVPSINEMVKKNQKKPKSLNKTGAEKTDKIREKLKNRSMPGTPSLGNTALRKMLGRHGSKNLSERFKKKMRRKKKVLSKESSDKGLLAKVKNVAGRAKKSVAKGAKDFKKKHMTTPEERKKQWGTSKVRMFAGD